MSKAILIIDMPENCFHCKLQDWANCRIVKGCHTGDKRPEWCPLKEVPQKQVHHSIDSNFMRGAKSGYNSCLYEILKGSEEE